MRTLLALSTLAVLSVISSAQLTLPFSGTDPGATVSAFQIIKSGTSGRANTLYITNASNTSDALLVNTVGLGRAAYFSITNAGNSQIALRADSNGSGVGVFGFMTGTGKAGYFRTNNTGNASPALHAQTNGTGAALFAQAGTGRAGDFQGDVRITGGSPVALEVVGGISATGSLSALTLAGAGASITNLNAGALSIGVVPEARLPANLARTNSSNTFFGTQCISEGAVGIGTLAPSRALHVQTVPGPQNAFTQGASNALFASSAAAGIQIVGDTSSRILMGSFSTGVNILYDPSTDIFAILRDISSTGISMLGNGNVGIGTNAPSTRLQVSGTITGTTKNFLIDHPADPLNRTLRHACVESDEYKNVYDGVTTTDANGAATVTLPAWFESLNGQFRYQLTIIDEGDDFIMAKVSREIQGGRFTIRTSQPRVKVSWQVTGVRKDAFVRDHPLIVDAPKPAKKKGTLLYSGAEQAPPKP